MGAVAINGDVTVKNGGGIKIYKNNQINDRSSITLKSIDLNKSSHIDIGGTDSSGVSERIGRLVIDYSGIIDFDAGNNDYHLQRSFYINDLIINPHSSLTIFGWQEGRDHLLVKRDSAHLEDALTKMIFKGYDQSNIHLESFDKDYWEISATPEPSTYGAILGAAGLILWAWRRKIEPYRTVIRQNPNALTCAAALSVRSRSNQ